MKYLFFILFLSFSANHSFAQWVTTNLLVNAPTTEENEHCFEVLSSEGTLRVDTNCIKIYPLEWILIDSVNQDNWDETISFLNYFKNISDVNIKYFFDKKDEDKHAELDFSKLKTIINRLSIKIDGNRSNTISYKVTSNIKNIPNSIPEINLLSAYVTDLKFDQWPTSLKTLRITNNAGTKLNINETFYNKLEELSISGDFSNSTKLQFPQSLKYLKIGTIAVYHTAYNSLPNIETLEVIASLAYNPDVKILNPKLKKLSIESNLLDTLKLSSLPSSIEEMYVSAFLSNQLPPAPNLKALSLIILMQLKNLNTVLNQYSKLDSLILWYSFNEKVTLPESLSSLDIASISASTIQQPIENLPPQLKKLRISSLSNQKTLPHLPLSLTELELSHSEIERIEKFSGNLKRLDLRNNNNLTCIPRIPESLSSFILLENTHIKCLPNETVNIKASLSRPLCSDPDKICNYQAENILFGKVFLDINNNGFKDSNDPLLPNTIISTDKNQLANSKDNGTYGIILRETGAYQLSAQYNHPSFKQSIPANVTVNYQEGQPIDSVHFLIQIENKNDVQINGTNLVARPGMSTKVVSFVENQSLVNKSNLAVKILKPADWTLEEALPTGFSVSNDTIIWRNVSLPRLKSSSFSVSSTLPPTATILGDAYQYQMWVENEGDITPENNYYNIIDTVRGSYDPNDKIVNHSTLTPELSNSKELIYTIRFQNTGTDTAFKVVIIDTIIGNLDPSSIRVLGASHNYTWNYSGQGVATFVFDNILLPDSNINEPGSHGFVTLALRPSKDLAVGDSIYNRAGIYFDFNEPVITNHANTKIATVTSVFSHSNIPLSIYPNPAKNQVRVEWKVSEPAILRISDISGKIIRTERLNNGFTDINVSQLPKGLYIVQLQTDQHMAVSKLIVQ